MVYPLSLCLIDVWSESLSRTLFITISWELLKAADWSRSNRDNVVKSSIAGDRLHPDSGLFCSAERVEGDTVGVLFPSQSSLEIPKPPMANGIVPRSEETPTESGTGCE